MPEHKFVSKWPALDTKIWSWWDLPAKIKSVDKKGIVSNFFPPLVKFNSTCGI